MSTVIYTERGRRELSAAFCEVVEQGESDRQAEEFSGLNRRTFFRWCRESPALAARYAQAVQARSTLYKRRKRHLKRLLAVERHKARGLSAKSPEGKAARVRVERLKNELIEFEAAVCCVRLNAPRRLRNAQNRAAR